MEVEALLCLTEAVIRTHKLREYNKRGGSKCCFSLQPARQSLTLTDTMELVWVTTSHLKSNFSYVLECMTILFSTK